MVIEATQSPEADLDREIEHLIGQKVRGQLTAADQVRLIELQSMRSRLMRPSGNIRKMAGGFYSRRFAEL
jgi:hypothetical protein